MLTGFLKGFKSIFINVSNLHWCAKQINNISWSHRFSWGIYTAYSYMFIIFTDPSSQLANMEQTDRIACLVIFTANLTGFLRDFQAIFTMALILKFYTMRADWDFKDHRNYVFKQNDALTSACNKRITIKTQNHRVAIQNVQ